MGYVKLVRSGNLIELYEYQKNLPDRGRKQKKDRERRSVSVKRRADNVERCRKAFTRLVRSNIDGITMPALCTFTMADVVSIDRAYRCFTQFVQRFRRVFGTAFRYIAVPEFQERGAVHFHVIFWGVSQKAILNERHTRQIQHLWGRGYVDCILTDGSVKLAGYLSKYMRKAMWDERLGRQKAYSSSRSVLRPVSLTSRTSVDVSLGVWGGVDNFDVVKVSEFDTMWLGHCRKTSYLVPSIESDENPGIGV